MSKNTKSLIESYVKLVLKEEQGRDHNQKVHELVEGDIHRMIRRVMSTMEVLNSAFYRLGSLCAFQNMDLDTAQGTCSAILNQHPEFKNMNKKDLEGSFMAGYLKNRRA